MTSLLIVFGACIVAFVISRVITWAASKSPFWNMGFAVVIVLAATVILVLALIVVINQLNFDFH